MNAHAKYLLVFLFSTVAGGCAAGTASIADRPSAQTTRYDRGLSPNRYFINVAEVHSIQATTAFEVVERLRPEFLRANRRGTRGVYPAFPDVYLNDGEAGGLDALRTIPVQAIRDIRLLSPVDAQMWFGPGHSAGVIVVRTR